jgi:hypothetical protein
MHDARNFGGTGACEHAHRTLDLLLANSKVRGVEMKLARRNPQPPSLCQTNA